MTFRRAGISGMCSGVSSISSMTSKDLTGVFPNRKSLSKFYFGISLRLDFRSILWRVFCTIHENGSPVSTQNSIGLYSETLNVSITMCVQLMVTSLSVSLLFASATNAVYICVDITCYLSESYKSFAILT